MSVSYAFAAAYRYMGITHSKVVRNHVTNRSIICALISVHLLGFAVTAFGYSGMTWDQQFLLSYFPIGNGHMDFDTLYIGSHFTESPNFLIALFFSMGVAVLTIFIVFYCSKKVNDRSRLHESLMRARTLTAQKLLVRALLIQAFMPTVLVIPLFIVSMLTLVVDTPPVLEYFSFSLIGWLPVLDPIITIYFVLPFRRLLLSWMPRFSFSNANVNRIFYDVCK
ncbi:unnamed protein product [Toxocara canis]|uniref:G protein-coupled receptor n=1 Tax=Toxocara canis TaxID=6265 RepID=A0A183TZ25_TOXCA|nr:unnamed protein product [Toxocara canis]